MATGCRSAVLVRLVLQHCLGNWSGFSCPSQSDFMQTMDTSSSPNDSFCPGVEGCAPSALQPVHPVFCDVMLACHGRLAPQKSIAN